MRLALLATTLTAKYLPVPRKNEIIEGKYDLPSGLTVEISQSVAGVKKDAWDQCVPDENLFLRWDFLRVFERANVSGLAFHYALVYENEKPVAAFYFQVIRLSAEEIGHILKPLDSNCLAGHWSEWLRRTKEEKGFRILISGNNFISGEYGLSMTKAADPQRIFIALSETVKIITRKDRTPTKISAILVKDYFSAAPVLSSDQLMKKRYHRFKVEPEMIVHLSPSWQTFDDYISAMSKKYRNRLKSVYRKSEAVTETEFDAAGVEKYSKELYALYLNVHQRAKFRLAALGENYFAEMKRSFPEQFRLTGYFFNGELVAFRSSFRFGRQLEAHFIGINYALNPEYHLYQRILYDFIKEGITTSAADVFLGRTAAEIKSTVGAVPHDLVCYIRHRNGLSNQVIRPFIDYLQPSGWIQRSPFKEEAEQA
jgi:predicted N-acyltransferase